MTKLWSNSGRLNSPSGGHFYDQDANYQDQEFYVIGDRVLVDNYRPGTVAYFGETEFASGDWVGVVLDEPNGNHDGKLQGREYFHCPPNRGLFVRTHRVSRTPDPAPDPSRTQTPSPTFQSLANAQGHQATSNATRAPTGLGGLSSSRCSSRSPAASSPMDSYYYDDDYRRERGPTAASLARKLESIGKQRQQHEQLASRSKLNKSTLRGILKHSNSAETDRLRSTESPMSGFGRSSSADIQPLEWTNARMDDLSRRLRASSVSPATRSQLLSQFSFRPQRVQRETRLDNHAETTQQLARRSVNLSNEPPKKGDRVSVSYRLDGESELPGTLRFMGETSFATGEWAGVELDEPVGKNDGSILGQRYFYCAQGHGLFVPASRIRKHSSGKGYDSMRSTLFSPPPKSTFTSRASLSGSTTPSYDLESISPSTNASSSSCNISSQSPSTLTWTRQHSLSDYRPEEPPTSSSSTRDLCTPSGQSVRHRPLFVSSPKVAKFDESDIEKELRKSLNAPRPSRYNLPPSSRSTRPAKPRAVEFTFISNKFDGNPVARRTLIYD